MDDDENRKRTDEWGFSDSDDEASRANTAPQSRRQSAKLKREQERAARLGKKPFHESLVKALAETQKSHVLTDITKTTALQGQRAEKHYRQRRPVHNSNVVPAAMASSVGSSLKREMERLGKDKENAVQSLGFERTICPYGFACKFMDDEDHMDKFLHKCSQGNLCTKTGDKHHMKFYWHPPITVDENANKGWIAEKKRLPNPIPDRGAAVYQRSVTAVSSAPRGGFRPAGGQMQFSEMREVSQKRPAHDHVVIKMKGLDMTWDEQQFRAYVQTHTQGFVLQVGIDRSHGMPNGGGFVIFQNYSDAQSFIEMLQGKPLGNNVLHLEYDTNLWPKRETQDYESSAVKGVAYWRDRPKDQTPILEFNRAIKRCGPYCDDAAALVQRMRMEGHKPTRETYIALIKSYRDAVPPRPGKAEQVLMQMHKEAIPIPTAACNYVVDAWARVDNLNKAEALIGKMDHNFIPRNPAIELPKDQVKYPLPNEETYEILKEGWQRLGMMEEVAHVRSGFFPLLEKNPKPIYGTRGTTSLAPSLVCSWGRRREGYLSATNMGLMTSARPLDGGAAIYKPSKWRPPAQGSD